MRMIAVQVKMRFDVTDRTRYCILAALPSLTKILRNSNTRINLDRNTQWIPRATIVEIVDQGQQETHQTESHYAEGIAEGDGAYGFGEEKRMCALWQ